MSTAGCAASIGNINIPRTRMPEAIEVGVLDCMVLRCLLESIDAVDTVLLRKGQ